ncbi:MAG: fucose isomerase, partial [Candidatus Lokiarchaeota archaeon]|nr:fucose isomerase [Candidatus Lokiarchaeota archaeon]MBD3199976.1 fucose isomerase [Candidatus Lokiarchaeota archaeon]
MKRPVKIGVVCLARKTFDYNTAFEIYNNIQSELELIEGVSWVFIEELVIEVHDAVIASHKLASEEVDSMIVISGTFALGHLVLELNKRTKKPILLWGLNELPYDGGRIRLNSVCGINLNASNLYKAGVKDFHVVIGDKIDEDWIDAIRIKKALSEAHVGVIGSRAHGFFNLDVDELNLYNKLGCLIDFYQLSNVFNQKIDAQDLIKRKEQLEDLFDLSRLKNSQIEKVAELIIKFDTFMETNNLTSIAVRCWPEFASKFGISPCAAMSVLQSEGKILTCEGDILGSLSMIAHKAVGANYPYLADFSQVDFKDDFGLLWHCGVAPCNLWDGKCVRALDSDFAEGKGVTADFVMKSGEISLLRFDYAPGEYRVFLQKGEAIPMDKELKGTYAKVKFPIHIRLVLDKIIQNGIAHHISVVYGNHIKPFEIFAK